MNYFVSKDELLDEINKAVNGIFTAVGRLFSEKDEELKRKLKELEANFLLLINTVGYKSQQSKSTHGVSPVGSKKRSKNMSEEERAIRPFSVVLDALFDYILQSEDHQLIILADELQESAKEGEETKAKVKQKLGELFKEHTIFLKDIEGAKKKKEEPSIIDDLPGEYERRIKEKEKKKT